jgi:hypothetical protein
MISPDPDVVAENDVFRAWRDRSGDRKGLVYYVVRRRSMHSGRRVAPETVWKACGGQRYNMPESFRAFCSIVSLTAAKTSRMLEVSVACVRLAGLA